MRHLSRSVQSPPDVAILAGYFANWLAVPVAGTGGPLMVYVANIGLTKYDKIKLSRFRNWYQLPISRG